MSRRSPVAALAAALVALLIVAQGVVTLYHGGHTREVKDCQACAVGHASLAVHSVSAPQLPAVSSVRPVELREPIEPTAPSIDSTRARAPPLSNLAA